jgi:hypothetical protein
VTPAFDLPAMCRRPGLGGGTSRCRNLSLKLSSDFFFRPSPLSFRQVDQHAVACGLLIKQLVNYVSHLGAKMGLNSRTNVGPDTQSYRVLSMPKSKQKNQIKTTQTKATTKQTKQK